MTIFRAVTMNNHGSASILDPVFKSFEMELWLRSCWSLNFCPIFLFELELCICDFESEGGSKTLQWFWPESSFVWPCSNEFRLEFVVRGSGRLWLDFRNFLELSIVCMPVDATNKQCDALLLRDEDPDDACSREKSNWLWVGKCWSILSY